MTDKLLTVFKIFAIILVVIAVLLVGWFLLGRFTGKEENGEEIGGQVQLIWWTLWEDKEDLQLLADRFAAQHPNITIKIEPQVSKNLYGSDYKESLLTQMSDNNATTGPDILIMHNTWLPSLQKYLTSMPASVMSSTEYASTFYPTAVDDFSGSSGGIYAIPLTFDGLGIYYNKDLLKRGGYTVPESTWDNIVEQAQDLTEYNNDGSIRIAGIGMGSSDNVDFYFEMVSLLMLQEGSDIVNNGSITFPSEDDMEAARALKFYTDFVSRYKVWDTSLPRDITMFTEGRLAMMIAPSWRVHDIQEKLESKGATLDFDIAPLPQQPSAQGTTIYWSDYWAQAVSKESEHPTEAWEFIEFISQPEQLRAFYERISEKKAFGEIYSRVDMASEIISDKYVGAYVQMANTARSWKMVDKGDMAEIFNGIIDDLQEGSHEVTLIHNKLENESDEMNKILASV